MSYVKRSFFLCLMGVLMMGCSSSLHGNVGNIVRYQSPAVEAEWIQNGEPIEYGGEYWFPQDTFDVLLDSEVYLIGEYRGIEFFVEKADVRPYNRLYTKFDRNKFRGYKKRGMND